MKFRLILILVITGLYGFTSCSKDEEVKAPMGVLEGVITSVTDGEAINGANIDLYFENGDPAGINLKSNENGFYSVELEPGNYFVKINKQGYNGIPLVGITPIAFSIIDKQTTTRDYSMTESEVENGGWITGTVSDNGSPVSGVMMIASFNGDSYSALSNASGIYTIYNVPAGNYNLKGWKKAYNSDPVEIVVEQNTEKIQHYTMESGALGALNGTITFLATQNGIVDVTLLDTESKQPIPGLAAQTDENGAYSLSEVPNGSYIAMASYKNDTYVIDPDWIFKFGEPLVTINNDEIKKDFSVTGAVTLIGSTNNYPEVMPLEITEIYPTFKWAAYSSTSDYVFELMDAEGNLIWGGISGEYGSRVKNVVIDPKNQGTQYSYPDDGSAPALEKGRVYRWRVYASKNNIQSPEGWELISVSEDQMGLFMIME